MKQLAPIGLIIIGIWALSSAQRQNDNPRIYYVKWLPLGYTALSIPPFGIFVRQEYSGANNLVIHELAHWKQYQREGLLKFLANYALCHNQYGYDLNPYEIEARFNESEFCKLNYTYCVRTGFADTVYNPTFRS